LAHTPEGREHILSQIDPELGDTLCDYVSVFWTNPNDARLRFADAVATALEGSDHKQKVNAIAALLFAVEQGIRPVTYERRYRYDFRDPALDFNSSG